MNWKNRREFYIVLLIIKIVHGVKVMTKFTKVAGDGDADVTCARKANDREYLAVMIDASNTCTSLDWNWGITSSYVTGATYYEKKHVVEIYEPPMVCDDVPKKLPIRFVAGSSIHMHITFQSDDFRYGRIQLVDSLDEWLDLYSGPPETIMIIMAMHPPRDYLSIGTWHGRWNEDASITPFPFTAGSTYKITFKALTNEMQILIDDVERAKYAHLVPPEDARMLQLNSVDISGMLLEKIEFIGN